MKVCIIPARGGSKRIPWKNIKTFIDQPIIAYSIDLAKKSELFNRIIVSTDSYKIASIAKKYDAEIPFIRPTDIANDHATTLDVIKHAIEWLEKNDERAISAICCLYATVPFARPSDLKKSLVLLTEKNIQYTFACTRFPFPIQRSIRMNHEGNVEMFWPEHLSTRSQDLEPAFHDAGMFYWGRPGAFASGLPIFAPHSKSVHIPHFRVQDIDEPDDWVRAEMLYEILSQRDEL
ncbi:pseudaminic acid cytidylyltransferase [Candidatus Enterovibrio altilux]|uniref:N-Acetylneuraminate cytidylyltransferase n=1 Tax=Candidatus Enterovibrio altilux TaxID=1927128 RepID=A0A291B7N2_9GAMM|nr:pseudaminic acid cytidylyltransferase [Candidatus Enterovibrio luxaltus]ATF09000.1 N-Acetylneuraminate cytidylyltransferase [Candidatus Enterovibrio luxaltus]